ALKDDNGNLIYDGEEEKIGFIDSVVVPVDSVDLSQPVTLRVFKEVVPPDSLDEEDTATTAKPRFGKKRTDKEDKELRYNVGVDTSDMDKRTHDVNKPVRITFSNAIDTYNTGRVFLSFDSAGTDVETPYVLKRDTTEEVLLLEADWKENTVYTIRLLKDFAQYTMKLLATPSKHSFRTKGEEDYGVLNLHIPSQYFSKKHLLKITTEKDTLYNKPVTDTSVTIRRLTPDKYSIFIIVDENGNGKWDTGDLFAKKQPELVLPYTDVIELKAGWENVIDFKTPLTEDLNPKPKPKAGAPPKRGEKPAGK
ncbi:MAG: Ig-like domain-containing protein, partial [Taibaiella sp.]|nr:Ig-like domain-containing protein [Taibaiella sp.]